MVAINSLLCEIRDSYFNVSHTYGANNAGISLWSYHSGTPTGGITGFLIENNIFYRNFPAVQWQYSCDGNYIGYNYVYEVRALVDSNNISGDAFDDNHGNHNMMNLYESNVEERFQSDGYYEIDFQSYSNNISVIHRLGYPNIGNNAYSTHDDFVK